MERDAVVMSCLGILALGGFAWWQVAVVGGTAGRVCGLGGLALLLVLAAAMVRAGLVGMRRSRARLGDELAEQMASLATSSADVDRLLRAEGGRLRPATLARTSVVLAAANEALKRWVVVSDSMIWRGRHGREAARLLTDLGRLRGRILDEIRIDRVTR